LVARISTELLVTCLAIVITRLIIGREFARLQWDPCSVDRAGGICAPDVLLTTQTGSPEMTMSYSSSSRVLLLKVLSPISPGTTPQSLASASSVRWRSEQGVGWARGLALTKK
jgi:hypothetical protein